MIALSEVFHWHHYYSAFLEIEYTFWAGRILRSRTTGQARLAHREDAGSDPAVPLSALDFGV